MSQQRFGDPQGSSGWKWEKNGVGMGGKTSGKKGSSINDVMNALVYCEISTLVLL